MLTAAEQIELYKAVERTLIHSESVMHIQQPLYEMMNSTKDGLLKIALQYLLHSLGKNSDDLRESNKKVRELLKEIKN